ncbi:MAG: asparagine synthase (glutamine-hydrolyzing) [Alphaproteobacteria bacterium]|jgi:asparagine synthase (glutamine-hydrolysing)|nr:asparagine synthase (glutamine-hydrolyzing) [Alphaproteobacteria bacterium]
MCGIAGFYGDFAPALLGRMAAALAHRGPDGEGLWHSPQHGIGLAHRRLSIIDLSTAASQPMAAVNDRYKVVFNGEIYNFKSLAQSADLRGYTFNHHSDTATLAPLFDKHGPAMLHHLEGMFAFALADTQQGTLFLARDHAGIKPLYYAITPHGLLFASELKALAAVAQPAGIDLTPDAAALQEYVSFLWTPSVRTPVQGIRKLRPGHRITLSRGQGGKVVVKLERWWQPPVFLGESAEGKGGYTPAALATLWDEIIAEQCTADVPPGAFLSGGVDSSAVVASMVATGHAPVQTYCIGFKGQGMAAEGFADDAHYANLMAKQAGVPLKTLQVEVDDTLAQLPQLAWLLDEPTADPAPLFVTAISQQARADGLKLLMSGTGGDDVLTGYRRHQSARLRELLGPLGGAAGGVCGLLARAAPAGALRRRLERLGGLLGGAEEAFLLNAFLTNSQPDAASLVKQGGQRAGVWGDELRAAIAETRGLPLVERLLRAESAGFLPDHNLNYGDKAGMAAGIEIRVPFTDRRLLQFMAQVPSRQKMHGLQPKAFFKQAMRGRVPDEILYRSKTGFGAPLRTWLQHNGKAVLQEVVENCDATRFDRPKVRRLWQRTLAGEVDGSYTVLAVALIEWWFAELKQRSSGRATKPL